MHNQTLDARALIADSWNAGVVPVVVWGNLDAFRFLYLNEDVDFETLKDERKHGLHYCGVMGVVGGKSKIIFGAESDARDIEVMRRAGVEFARQHRARQTGDELTWLDCYMS